MKLMAIERVTGRRFVMTLHQGRARFTDPPMLPWVASFGELTVILRNIFDGKMEAYVQGEPMDVKLYTFETDPPSELPVYAQPSTLAIR